MLLLLWLSKTVSGVFMVILSTRERTIRVATRDSDLALWQARHVVALLQKAFPAAQVQLCPQKTLGDRQLQAPMAELGSGYGVFVRELQVGLLEGSADLAVHSLKDMPSQQPEGLALLPIGPRANVTDAWLSATGLGFYEVPAGSRVGTAARRRVAMLRKLRPDLTYVSVRGNVPTRLRKLREGEVDALVLASAGLERLGLASQIVQAFDPVKELVPAPGQGLLGVEYRHDDAELATMLAALQQTVWSFPADLERLVMRKLEGGCQLPLGVHCQQEADGFWHLQAHLLSVDASLELKASCRFKNHEEGMTKGLLLSERLLAAPEMAVIKASLAI